MPDPSPMVSHLVFVFFKIHLLQSPSMIGLALRSFTFNSHLPHYEGNLLKPVQQVHFKTLNYDWQLLHSDNISLICSF